MTPAERLAARKPRRRAPRNAVPARRVVWRCTIRDLRESLNISLRDVSQSVGISVAALWQIEMGSDCVLTTARKLCEFYGRTVEELWVGRAKKGQTS